MVAQTFFFYEYINSFQINIFFLSITLKFIFSLVLQGLGGLFKVILVGTGVQLKLRKHPNAYIALKWNLNLLVITFLTTLTPLARVVLRNDASPSDGDNKRLVCVKGDQCHDHIKDIWKRVDYKDRSCTPQTEEWHHLFQPTMNKWF
jgi:hypothetical protein